MRSVILFLACVLFASCSMQRVESQKRSENPQSEITDPQSKQLVLVELFTSEGCSSCPPAERNLAFLEKEQPAAQAEVITLAFHVDYWDDGGWKDVYSSPFFTQRQQSYSQKFNLDSIYTPQMVVDGKTEFVGSDSGRAAKIITEAAKNQKGTVEVVKNEDKLTIRIAALPEHENATVYLAIAEDNLVSDVARGENLGKTLEHQSVVRALKSVGDLNSRQRTIELETVLQLNSNWKRENLKIIVFAQENGSRKILGVGKIHL